MFSCQRPYAVAPPFHATAQGSLGGRAHRLLTPPLAAGLLPGILRAELLARGLMRVRAIH
ncbi:MAG: hypothetical protein PXZ07_03895 [Candidatus Eremiobacteraeota bacterium]|nr:hypothetical protein [Candidatus Eremiobacteraeota bacterium]